MAAIKRVCRYESELGLAHTKMLSHQLKQLDKEPRVDEELFVALSLYSSLWGGQRTTRCRALMGQHPSLLQHAEVKSAQREGMQRRVMLLDQRLF